MTKNLTKREIVLKINEQFKEIPQKGILDIVQMTLDTIGKLYKAGAMLNCATSVFSKYSTERVELDGIQTNRKKM